jgi:transposase
MNVAEFPASPVGCRQLSEWLRGHGRVVKVGVEGSGSA